MIRSCQMVQNVLNSGNPVRLIANCTDTVRQTHTAKPARTSGDLDISDSVSVNTNTHTHAQTNIINLRTRIQMYA